MKKNKLLALLLVLALTCGLMAGCGSAAGSAAASGSTAEEASASAETAAAPAEAGTPVVETEASAEEAGSAVEAGEPEETESGEVVLEYVELPVEEEEVHYTCWMPVAPFLDMIGVSLDEFSSQISLVRTINEATNVYIDFQAVAGGVGEEEKFNLMIAARDYCDIIGLAGYYPTGVEGAIEDDVLIDIREGLEEYAPNYINLLKANQGAYLKMITDSGQMGSIAQLLSQAGSENMGMLIRKDWLDEGGLDTPETLDDFEEYLQYCKDTHGAYAYLDYGGSDFDLCACFNVNGYGYMVQDGTVIHAYNVPAYQDYLAKMHDWYQKGFFHDDFYNDTEITKVRYDMANDLCCYVTNSALGMSDIYNMNPDNTAMELMAIHYPKAPGVDVNHVGFESALIKTKEAWSITTACDDPVSLFKLVNWLYSEEGQLVYNWGEEGVSFEYDENGDPQWTDLIINNPDGLSYLFASFKYASGQATTYYPGVLDLQKGFYNAVPGQLEALETLATLTDGLWNIDSGVVIPLELQTEYASLSTEVSTYADGEILRFIIGDRDLSTYDDFLATVESMGLPRMTEIEQEAYDLYMSKLD